MQAQQLLLAQGLICSCTLYLQCLQGQGWVLPWPSPSLPAGSAFACPLVWSVTCVSWAGEEPAGLSRAALRPCLGSGLGRKLLV